MSDPQELDLGLPVQTGPPPVWDVGQLQRAADQLHARWDRPWGLVNPTATEARLARLVNEALDLLDQAVRTARSLGPAGGDFS